MKFRKITSDIFVIEDLMPKEICETYIQLSENIGYQPAALQFGKTRVVRENVRNNLSIDHKDTSLATALWKLCGKELPQTSPYGRLFNAIKKRLPIFVACQHQNRKSQ